LGPGRQNIIFIVVVVFAAITDARFIPTITEALIGPRIEEATFNF
jgi:hypothetical protein